MGKVNPRDADNLAILRRSIRETDVVSAIRDLLLMHGAVVLRQNSGAAVGDDGRYIPFVRWWAPGHRDEQAGAPDLIVLLRGSVFAIEVKRPGGRQSPMQRVFQAAWEAAGGWYVLADSVDAVQQELGL